METGGVLGIALAILFATLAWRLERRHREAVRRRRRDMWNLCLPLFEQAEVVQEDIGFPTLRARYGGHRVILEPIADHVGYRKVPQLWLRATMFAALPVQGSFDYLARPENLEFYSMIWSLPRRLRIPPAWPAHAALRTDCDEETSAALVETLSPHMRIFDDPNMKELHVSEEGVRAVYCLEQSDRARYAVFRSVQFDRLVVPSGMAEPLLIRMRDMIRDLRELQVRTP